MIDIKTYGVLGSVEETPEPTGAERQHVRAKLLAQVEAAQAHLTDALKHLAGHASAARSIDLDEGRAYLNMLAMVKDQLAGPDDKRLLSHINASAVIAAAGRYTAEVRSAEARAEAAGLMDRSAALAQATTTAHRDVKAAAHDVFDRRIFDPYLRFTSPQDEEEYRKHEAERKRYIEEQQAKGTPQAELNATNAMLKQLDDARAHGADRSPDFAPMQKRLLGDRDRLAAQEKAQTADRLQPAEVSSTEKPHEALSKDAASVLLAAGASLCDSAAEGHGVTAQTPRVSGVRTV